MAFIFAYTLDGDTTVNVMDYQAAIVGDTQPTGAQAAGAYTPRLGDVVMLNSAGRVTSAAVAATSVLGVTEGPNFQGLVAQGQPNAAYTITNNSQNNVLSKTIIDLDAVYRVPLKNGATAPVIGTAYGIALVSTGGLTNDPQIDTSVTAAGSGAIYKVVDYDVAKGNVYVAINARQMI